MIPQSIKDLLNSSENTGLFQTIALLIFLSLFIGLVFFIFSKPKKYYKEHANAPLEDDKPFQL